MSTPRLPLLLMALLACGPTAQPAASTPSPSSSATTPAPRPVVRSCPAVTKPTTVDFDPRISLGDHDGITWLYGYAAHNPVLAHLGADDKLVLTPIPLRNAEAGVIEDGRIWLYAPDPPTRWLSVDITDPEKPLPGAIAPLTTGAQLDRPAAFAVGRHRALAIVGQDGQRDLVLLDTATRTNIAPPHPLDLTFRPFHVFCGDDSCSVIAMDYAPDLDAAQQLVVLRVLPDGTREQERLTTGWSGDPAVAEHGDRILVAWPTRDGIRLRFLDRAGHPLAPSVPVPWDSNKEPHATRLFHAEHAVVLAVGEHNRWSVALIGPHGNPGPLRELPEGTGRRLFAAPLGDGLAWISLGDAVNHNEFGRGVLLDWEQSEAIGGFLPLTGEPAPSTPLALGDLEPYILTRPGAAAALIRQRGDDISAPTFALLRATCKLAPGQEPPRVGPPALDGLGTGGSEKCRNEPQ